MVFAPDTEVALRTVVRLINSAANGEELLATMGDLDRFLQEEGFSGARARDAAELASVHKLRSQLAELWTMDEDTAVGTVNRLLREANALPQLIKHDAWDYHLHPARPDAPLAARIAFEAAMALVGVVRRKELSRLRICAYPGCGNVAVDLTKNRSKRFCDNGCGNRAAVEAYRARKAAAKP